VTDLHWHREADLEILRQDRRIRDRQTRQTLRGAQTYRAYRNALYERLNFLDEVLRGWYGD
jgi:hypothetical protein